MHNAGLVLTLDALSALGAQMREADKGRRGKKQRGGFADDQEEADPTKDMAKSFKKRRY